MSRTWHDRLESGMTVRELLARFPEIPPDLHEAPVLARFAGTFDALLCQARMPSPCATAHDAANHYYLKLIGPLAIYGYGLSRREQVLADIEGLLERHARDPQGFAASLVPSGAAAAEVRGPDCR
jgi:hypothetical protein